MLKSWQKLQEYPDMKHCFFVPCDSHGIQLLIKDLLHIPSLKVLHDQAQAIVKAFKKAPLQYARLRDYQVQTYGFKQALCLSVITRWGTQFRLIDSVLKNKKALRRYAFDHQPNDLAYDEHEYIMSSDFWAALEPLHELVQPIDETLKMSESNKASLDLVLGRWASIHGHLTRMKSNFQFLDEFLTQDSTFQTRFARQVHSIHIVAFYLTPANHDVPMDAKNEVKVFAFFSQYMSADDAKTLRTEFLYYRNQLPPFENTRVCWEHADEPRIFWLMQMEHTKIIGKFGVRIHSTPANSVPSERAHATWSLIHTKLCNSLKSERVNKLTYTYINDRILHGVQNDQYRSPHTLSTVEEVEIEETMLENEEADSEEMEVSDSELLN